MDIIHEAEDYLTIVARLSSWNLEVFLAEVEQEW